MVPQLRNADVSGSPDKKKRKKDSKKNIKIVILIMIT